MSERVVISDDDFVDGLREIEGALNHANGVIAHLFKNYPGREPQIELLSDFINDGYSLSADLVMKWADKGKDE